MKDEGLAPGRRIGRYRLVRALGAGGMGAVYEAEQEDPRRTVALKLLARAEDPEAVARFRYEAEILAQLSHPHIAQVYEAGVEPRADGAGELFWFAMEHVAGARTLIEHAQGEGLALDARLRLFLRVADAVQHGHQKGVIHRDLKPGNLLVDSGGRPKVIDFGIARISGDQGPQRSLRTSTGQVLGTMRYMSPEQVSGERGAVDARSDVFALGLVLFELATDRPAYELEGLPLTEAVRAVADARVPGLREVDRELPRELEWVVRRACALERERRYPSVSELSADIERLLAGEAVSAGPATVRYRTRVFVRRHRFAVASAALIVLSLAAALAVTSRSLARERRSLAAEREQRRRAEGNAAFLREMIGTALPTQEGYEVRVVDVLDRAAPQVAARFAEQPLLEADLHYTVADAFRHFGRHASAVEHARAAVALLEARLAPDDPELLRARTLLGVVLRGSDRLEDAEPLLRQTLVENERRYGTGSTATIGARGSLVSLLIDSGRLDEAQALLEEWLAGATPETVVLDEGSLRAIDGLVRLLLERQDFDALQAWLDRLEEEPGPLPESLQRTVEHILSIRAGMLAGAGDHAAAEAAFLEALERAIETAGPSSHQALAAMGNLANVATLRGDGDAALTWLGEALVIADEAYGAEHALTLDLRYNYASALWTLGEKERAEAELTGLLEQSRSLRPDARLLHAEWAGTLGRMRVALGRPADGVELLRESLAGLSADRGDAHPTTQQSLRWLIRALDESGRPDEAAPLRPRLASD